MSRNRTDYAGIASPAKAGKSSTLRGPQVGGPQSSGFIFSDPRLEGIPGLSVGPAMSGMRGGGMPGGQAGQGQGSGGYDLAAQRYMVTHEDPYAEMARRETEIGRRMPRPYQAASAMAGQMLPPERGESQYTEIYDATAAYNSANYSGQHSTQWGTIGRPDVRPAYWDARQQFGAMGSRSRDGFSDEWDARAGRERRSGRLDGNMSTMSQRIDPRFPYLRLRAYGATTDGGNAYNGNAQVRVTAGLSETGGAQPSRLFWLGGGFNGEFDLQGFEQCTVEVVDILAGTWVEFAWATNGMQSGSKDLFLPQRITPAVGGMSVPEGAYQVIVEDPTPGVAGSIVTIAWTTANAAGGGVDLVFTQTVSDNSLPVVTGSYFGQRLDVLGTNVAWTLPGGIASVDVVWILRTI